MPRIRAEGGLYAHCNRLNRTETDYHIIFTRDPFDNPVLLQYDYKTSPLTFPPAAEHLPRGAVMTTPQRPTTHAATLQDIANACGVSRATVSRALRNHVGHNQETIARIHEMAAELGYNPARFAAARRLSLSQFGKQVNSHLVALFFPSHFYRSTYHARLFEGLWEALAPDGFGLLIVRGDPELPQSLPASFSQGDVDGAIINAAGDGVIEEMTLLRANAGFGHRPVVLLDTSHLLSDAALVAADHRTGNAAAAGHLLDLGHRHLLCTTHRDATGYRQAYLERGLDPDTYLHRIYIGDQFNHYAMTPAHLPQVCAPQAIPWAEDEPLPAYLHTHPEVTGILAPNDPAALLIHYLLTREGRRVPEDYSLIGCDDTAPLYNAAGQNTLTTIYVPLEEIGRQAARCLLRQLLDDIPCTEQVLLPTELIVRASTAPPNR